MRQVRIVDGEVITLPDPPVDPEALLRGLENVALDRATREPAPHTPERA